ncbi:MAG: hypothetical protein LC648_00370 [Novosphingobium sp.]|nr:hypothetical protein [Novosphingobium sp.]
MRSAKIIPAGILMLLSLPLAAQQNLPLTPPVSTDRDSSAPARPTPPIVARTGAVPLEANDVNAFLDGLIPYALASGDIAGGVIVVVKDGRSSPSAAMVLPT